MRWRVSLLAAEVLLIVGATGWSCNPHAFFPAVCTESPKPSRLLLHSRSKRRSRSQHQEEQHVEFKGLRRRRRLLHTIMTAAAEGGGGCGSGDDLPSKDYNKDAWQRRASRAMKYVSMPIVKKAGQPREQVPWESARPPDDVSGHVVVWETRGGVAWLCPA